jgi:hypothetical protein
LVDKEINETIVTQRLAAKHQSPATNNPEHDETSESIKRNQARDGRWMNRNSLLMTSSG